MRNLGFTLIEFTIYVAIIGVISVLMFGFLWNIIFGNIKAVSEQEVQENARFALTKITQEIKKATGIESPSIGNSDNTLELVMANQDLNPTRFELINNKLVITQGGQTYELTSDQVIVSNLNFTNLSYQDTSGAVQIEMTIEYPAPLDSKTTVSLLPGGAAP